MSEYQRPYVEEYGVDGYSDAYTEEDDWREKDRPLEPARGQPPPLQEPRSQTRRADDIYQSGRGQRPRISYYPSEGATSPLRPIQAASSKRSARTVPRLRYDPPPYSPRLPREPPPPPPIRYHLPSRYPYPDRYGPYPMYPYTQSNPFRPRYTSPPTYSPGWRRPLDDARGAGIQEGNTPVTGNNYIHRGGYAARQWSERGNEGPAFEGTPHPTLGFEDAKQVLSNGGSGSQHGADFAFIKVEQEGLSETLQLNPSHHKPFAAVYSLHGDAKARAWKQPKTDLTQDDAACELLNVYALQHALGSNNFDKITLTCPGGPSKRDSDAASIQLRWLYVQRSGLTLELLKDLVWACPYVSRDLCAVTAQLLEEIRFKHAKTSDSGAYLEPGSIMRYLSKPIDRDEETEHQKTEAVLFASCPQLVMKEIVAGSTEKQSQQHNYHTRTLLQTLYNYDTGGDDREQIVQKMISSKSDQVLHVNELWCLQIGSGILITMSDLPARKIQGETVTIDERPSGNGELLTIQLLESGRQHNSVVDAACTYVDLVKHCVLLAAGDTSRVLDYEILDLDDEVLTPNRWLELLSSTKSYNFKFYLERKKTQQSRYRGDDAHKVHPGLGVRQGTGYGSYNESLYPYAAISETPNFGSRKSRESSSIRYRESPRGISRRELDGSTLNAWRAREASAERRTPSRQKLTADTADKRAASEGRRVRFQTEVSSDEKSRPAPRLSSKEREIDISVREPKDKVEGPGSREDFPRPSPPLRHSPTTEAVRNLPADVTKFAQAATFGSKDVYDQNEAEQSKESALVLYRPTNYTEPVDVRTQSSWDVGFQIDPDPSINGESALVLYKPRAYYDEDTGTKTYRDNRFQKDPEPNEELALVLYRPRHYSEGYDKGTKVYRDTRFRPDPDPVQSDVNTSFNGQRSIVSDEQVRRAVTPNVQSWLGQVYVAQDGSSPPDPSKQDDASKVPEELTPIILQVEPRPRHVTFSENPERAVVPWKPEASHRKRSQSAPRMNYAKYGDVVNDPDLKKHNRGPQLYRLEDGPPRSGFSDAENGDGSTTIAFPETTDAETDDVFEGFSDDTLAEKSKIIPSHILPYEGRYRRDVLRRRENEREMEKRVVRPGTPRPYQLSGGSYRNDDRNQYRMSKPSSRSSRRSDAAHISAEQVQGSGEAITRRRSSRYYRRSRKRSDRETIFKAFQVEPDVPGAIGFPFLTWKLQEETSVQDHVAVEGKLARIMTSVEQTLLQSELRMVYSQSFGCTMQHLQLRHTHLSRPFEDKPFTSLQDFKNHARKMPDLMWLGEHVTPPAQQQADDIVKDLPDKTSSPVSSSPEQKTQGPPDQREQRIARPVIYDSHTMKVLMGLSQDILSAFIPDSRFGSSHALSQKFWGALDGIYRQLNWESSGSDIYNHLFTIANFDTLKDTDSGLDNAASKTWKDCQDCCNRQTYMSVPAALSHLHTHMACSCTPASRPYEDPCYSWVECVPDYRLDEREPSTFVLKTVDRFIETVSLIRDHVKELHVLVAKAGNKETKIRPPLANSLVDALIEILKLYVLEARALTYTNRIYHEDYLKHERDRYRNQLKRVQDRERDAQITTIRLLQDAKKDIVLLGTTGHDDMGLAIESVGAEFLLIALISSIQNSEVIPGDYSVASERQDSSHTEIYRRYVSDLNYQASRRPKRRVFKDIHHFQQELAAVNTINKAQHTLLDKLLRLLDPDSFRITNETRRWRFRAEKALALRQQRRLEARTKNILDLIDKTTNLKNTVKQMVEIIDEDHGKAIRVFTIVTLFFLPLSFVSSFMGMNTTDIRGMDYGQTIFWATAVPVTVLIVTVALLYGYYGDEIGDWMHDSGWLGRRRKVFSPPNRGKREVKKVQTTDSLGF